MPDGVIAKTVQDMLSKKYGKFDWITLRWKGWFISITS